MKLIEAIAPILCALFGRHKVSKFYRNSVNKRAMILMVRDCRQ